MKILVGYDGSNAADAALFLACSHAQTFLAHVMIVTVIESSTASYGTNMEEATNKLSAVAKNAMDKGIQIDTRILSRGFRPGEELVKFSKEQNTDLIYIGIKKKSKIDKMLFGSNAQFIILNALCPVMTVKP
jgi:nucleotide-binding universal stress UspA family protein